MTFERGVIGSLDLQQWLQGPTLDAMANELAIETLTIVAESLTVE